MRRPGELFHAPPQRIRLLVAGERPAGIARHHGICCRTAPARQSALLRTFGQQQLDWILGETPSTPACWRVRNINNPEYTAGYPNARSATASPPASMTKNDVAFYSRGVQDRLDQNWRWGAMDPARRLVRPGHHLAERTRRPPWESSSHITGTGRVLDPPYRQPGLP